MPVSATAKFAPEIATRARRNFSRRWRRAASASSAGSSVRPVRRGSPDPRHLGPEDVADLGPVAVDRGDEEVRRQVPAQLDDELREVRLPGGDPGLRERLVELDLLGRHRLDLDDLVRARIPDEPDDDRVRLLGIARPVDDAARRGDVRLELDEQLRQAREDVVLDRGPGEPQLLPVLDLGDRPRALLADRRRGALEVARSCSSASASRAALGNGGVPANRGVGGGTWRGAVMRAPIAGS